MWMRALGYHRWNPDISLYRQKPADRSPSRWYICRVLGSEPWERLAPPQHVQDIKLDLSCRESSRCVSVCVKLDRWSLAQGIWHTKALFTQLWFLRLKRPASVLFGLMGLDAGSYRQFGNDIPRESQCYKHTVSFSWKINVIQLFTISL